MDCFKSLCPIVSVAAADSKYHSGPFAPGAGTNGWQPPDDDDDDDELPRSQPEGMGVENMCFPSIKTRPLYLAAPNQLSFEVRRATIQRCLN